MQKSRKGFQAVGGQNRRVLRIMQRHCEFLEESLACWAAEATGLLASWSEDKALELADYLDKTSKSVGLIFEESLKHLRSQVPQAPSEPNEASSIRSRQVSKDTVLDFHSFNTQKLSEITEETGVADEQNWKTCKVPIKKLITTFRPKGVSRATELQESIVYNDENQAEDQASDSPKTPLEASKERSKADSSSITDMQKYGTDEESKMSEDRPLFVFTSQTAQLEHYSYRLFKFNNLSRVV